MNQVINDYNSLLVEYISAIKLKINEYTTLNIGGNQIYSSSPYLTFYSEKKISNFFQLEDDYKNLLNHHLIESLTVSSLYSRPPIQIEDPGGGIPSNPYDMFYIKQTVNDTLLKTGSGVKIDILETYWGSIYSMVDPSTTYFKSGNVRHDPNIQFNSYAPHATTVAVLSSGHHGIAKDSKIYSSSFKPNYPTDYTISQALSWLSQKSSSNYDNIDVDIINMSFTSSSPIQEIRDFAYLNRKIMISGAGNYYNDKVGYPGAFPNVFSVGVTNQSGDSIWINTNLPEEGSAYINNSNGIDKPNIVAPGMVSFPNLPYSGDFIQGTSFSSPLVAGAVAKLLEARPYLKLYPELVYALLKSTANQSILTNIDQQYLFNIGEKTGSGLLDITKLVNNRDNTHLVSSNDLMNNKITFSVFLNNPTHTETTINIAAYWFEKIENNNPRLSNYDLSMNINGVVATSNSLYNNYELIKLTTRYHGQISVTLELKQFSGTHEDLIGIAWTVN